MKHLIFCSFLFLSNFVSLGAAELRIVCSVPELADLVKLVGGEAVSCEALARPQDNPHFLNARPSFIRKLSRADAFVVIGMDLEVGWAPVLVNGARNNKIRPGQLGYLDCSAAITPLEKPTGKIDRSQGDVHPHGNPHYLLSPLCGIEVIGYLGERLGKLDASRAAVFKENAQAAQKNIAEAFFGTDLVAAYEMNDLITWQRQGNLKEKIGDTALGGWLKELAGMDSVKLIDDHKQWPYLAQALGFRIVAHLEPKPGIPPSTKHLQSLIAQIQSEHVNAIIATPWFDPRHAKLVSEAGKVPLLMLAHQAGSLDHTETYLKLCAYNVAQLKTLVAK